MKTTKYTVILISHPNPDCTIPCICYDRKEPILVDTWKEAEAFADRFSRDYRGYYSIAKIEYEE